jgi:DNA-binding NarL/FixJ family response regulator
MLQKIKLVIADDHPMVIDGLVTYFSTFNEIEIVATTNNLNDVIKLVETHSPNILLLDYHFLHEEVSCLDVCHSISKNHPCTKVIVISSFDDTPQVKEFIDAGANGYLLKTASRLEYIDAILHVIEGGVAFGKDVHELIKKGRHNGCYDDEVKFTKTEKQILKLIVDGHTTKEIANRLCREVSTIDSHRKNILLKFHLMDKENPSHSKNISHYIAKFNIKSKIDCY